MTFRVARSPKRKRSPRVLIIVQNLPVPLDRRVWLECEALIAQGYQVSVICPKGPNDPARQVIDGVAIYKYAPPPAASGAAGYLYEFAYCWLRTALLSVRVWRERGFDVIQACNPPDTYWALARLWKRRGVRFVFDHHDLNPELFLSRFGAPESVLTRAQLRGLLWLERMTFRSADHVISTNASYRSIAIRRGRLRAEDVTVVRSGPDTTAMRPVYPKSDIRLHAGPLLAYLGVMGPQDGVDKVLDLVAELVFTRGRTDLRAVVMGFGDCLTSLQQQCSAAGLDPYVTFTGRVGPDTIAEYLSAADIGIGPDLKTPLNDLSTMNKTMEYMAFALPSVSFDLTETRFSGGSAAVYVPSGDIPAFADEVEDLLDDPARRSALGRAARRRAEGTLDWQTQAQAYVGVFAKVLDRPVPPPQAEGWPFSPRPRTRPTPATTVDLDDPTAFERFLVTRGRSGTGARGRRTTSTVLE
jgi:glycosyltransferase involved in cell wall biosynthesis